MEKEQFQVTVKAEEDKIHGLVRGNLKESYEYAFYLKKNGQRTATQWYTKSNRVSFQVDGSGSYCVICFIREGESMISIDSPSVMVNADKKSCSECRVLPSQLPVSIFGSCVTRDALEYDYRHYLKLNSYICRQSMVSSVSAPVICSIEDINLQSKFQRRQVYNDLVKNMYDMLNNDSSRYLIIDLIDERFRLITYQGSLITDSTYLQESRYITKGKLMDYNTCFGIYMINNRPLKAYVNKFCDRILNIYPSDRIIIHKAYMADSYLGKDGKVYSFDHQCKKNNKKINKRLEYLYGELQNHFQQAKVIDLSSTALAWEGHKWGLGPMHYVEDYYRNVVGKIYNFLENEI